MEYGYKKKYPLAFDVAVQKTKDALLEEGFGILTEIDVKATLKKKLGVEYGRYVILGACNPSFAFKALAAEKDIGLLLPCNVIIYEERGDAVVSAILPTVAMGMVDHRILGDIAKTVEDKLKRAVDGIRP